MSDDLTVTHGPAAGQARVEAEEPAPPTDEELRESTSAARPGPAAEPDPSADVEPTVGTEDEQRGPGQQLAAGEG